MEGGTNPSVWDRYEVHTAVKHVMVECLKCFMTHKKYYSNPSIMTMLKETDDISTINLEGI